MVPVVALGLMGASLASAHGWYGGFGANKATPEEIATRQTDMFQHQADLLGVSVEEVKAAWAEGKTLKDVADAHGITQEQIQQKMQDQRKQAMQDYFTTLVNQGVITQAQADQRMQFMNTQAQNGKGRFGRGMMHHGFGMGFGF